MKIRSTAVSNQGGATFSPANPMEADTISKNGRSSKSQMSRGNTIINMLNRKFLSVLLVAVLTAGYAQGQRFGARVGVNYTNKSLNTSVNALLQKGKYNIKFTMKPGFQIGGIIEGASSENQAMQMGLLISSQKCVFDRIEIKSGKVDVSDIEYPEGVILNLTYLRLPMHGVFKKDLGDVTFLAFVGPYVGLAVAGKIHDEKLEFGKEGVMSRFDFGINLGPGIQFGNVQAAVEYSIGVGLNANTFVTRNTINNGFSLNLTYLFGK